MPRRRYTAEELAAKLKVAAAKKHAADMLASIATVGNAPETAKRGRKRVNLLWKKKRNIINKSAECAIYCN